MDGKKGAPKNDNLEIRISRSIHLFFFFSNHFSHMFTFFLEIKRHFYRKPFISSMNKIHPGGVELEHGVEARDRTAGPEDRTMLAMLVEQK